MKRPDAPPAADPPDRVEIWARRTGRVLGYLFVVSLGVYLVIIYGPR